MKGLLCIAKKMPVGDTNNNRVRREMNLSKGFEMMGLLRVQQQIYPVIPENLTQSMGMFQQLPEACPFQ